MRRRNRQNRLRPSRGNIRVQKLIEKEIDKRIKAESADQVADLELFMKALLPVLRGHNSYDLPIQPLSREKLKRTAVHGHELLMKVILADFYDPENKDKNFGILEVGTVREYVWTQGSTSRLACLARLLGGRMISVDIDPQNTSRAMRRCEKYAGYTKFVTLPGERYLENAKILPKYIYLDAYDFEHPGHSERRQLRYEVLTGERINNSACWQMHLECARQIALKLPIDGVLVFDDVWFESGEWQGKGKTAIPYLLQQGFKIVGQSWSTIAMKRRLKNDGDMSGRFS